MSVLTQTASLLRSDTVNPEDKYDHEIQLVDHTKPREEEPPGELNQAPTRTETENPQSPGPTSPLSLNWTHGSLRDEFTKRKYKKWREDRVVDAPTPIKKPTTTIEEEPNPEDEEATAPQKLPSKRDTFRSQRYAVKDAVKDVIRGPRPKHVHNKSNSVYDVLYENQRGMFLLGVPRFSSKSLLNFDPPSWQTATYHPSPVDITNAQVPDPSWVWAEGWKNWYVDMTGDVDEEGWRYSFAFGQRGRFSWHGTHPWFHSFVRRRRWVKLRVKRGHALSGGQAPKTMHEAHMLNAEYFTIHNIKGGGTPDGDSYTMDTKRQSAATSKRWSVIGEDHPSEEELEIRDISTLLARLRKAPIDREKVAAVRTFLDQGGEELYYLGENMRDIMSLFVFQSSRRQLLALLLKRFEDATEQQQRDSRKKRKEKETDTGQGSDEKRLENLRGAIEAADEECKHLEYWSDVRDVVKDGELVGAMQDWGQEWQGVEKSGPGSEDVTSPYDSGLDEENKSPVGKTTVFADDIDDGRPLEELDGANDVSRAGKPEETHEDESPLAEEVNSPEEEHPYDPDVADEHQEPGEASEDQGMRDSGDGVD